LGLTPPVDMVKQITQLVLVSENHGHVFGVEANILWPNWLVVSWSLGFSRGSRKVVTPVRSSRNSPYNKLNRVEKSAASI